MKAARERVEVPGSNRHAELCRSSRLQSVRSLRELGEVVLALRRRGDVLDEPRKNESRGDRKGEDTAVLELGVERVG